MIKGIENYLNPKKSAILVIDIQNDFCHSKGHFGKNKFNLSYIHNTIPRIQNFVKKSRSLGVKIIHIRSFMDQKFLSPSMRVRNTLLGRQKGICLKGSWGAKFYKIIPEKKDIILTKHTYSAFIGTGLTEILKKRDIQSLLITGVLTNVCCESTLRDGFMLGFFTFLVEDCCASVDKKAHLASIENVNKYFGWVCKSNDIITYWFKFFSLILNDCSKKQKKGGKI